MERCPNQPDARSVDAHGIEHFSIHDVEAAASIHQHLGEPLHADDRVDHEWVFSSYEMLFGWSVRSKIMVNFDHRRKEGVANSAV